MLQGYKVSYQSYRGLSYERSRDELKYTQTDRQTRTLFISKQIGATEFKKLCYIRNARFMMLQKASQDVGLPVHLGGKHRGLMSG